VTPTNPVNPDTTEKILNSILPILEMDCFAKTVLSFVSYFVRSET